MGRPDGTGSRRAEDGLLRKTQTGKGKRDRKKEKRRRNREGRQRERGEAWLSERGRSTEKSPWKEQIQVFSFLEAIFIYIYICCYFFLLSFFWVSFDSTSDVWMCLLGSPVHPCGIRVCFHWAHVRFLSRFISSVFEISYEILAFTLWFLF